LAESGFLNNQGKDMYGLVNRAVEELVVSLKGEAGWRGVCAHANVSPDGFVAMKSYDDDVTFRLVAAVSARMDLPAEQVLEAFGKYWITYTAEQGYSSIMAAGGKNLREFLGNLNEMHGRVETIFPQLRLPLFRVEDIADGEYRVYYASTRAGLAPMVVGLIKGLAERFEQSVEVSQVYAKTELEGEDVFLVRQLPRNPE
jgi:hypothetical protein